MTKLRLQTPTSDLTCHLGFNHVSVPSKYNLSFQLGITIFWYREVIREYLLNQVGSFNYE